MDTEFEQLTKLIHAHDQGEELSTSFRKVYLDELLRRSGSPRKALDKLVTCLKYYKKLEVMEDKMDRTFFAELVCSDFVMNSGSDEDGRPICWIRLGAHRRVIWNLKKSTPRFWAFVRAFIFCHQTSIATMCDSPFAMPTFFVDDAEATNLGFNLALEHAFAIYSLKLNPVLPDRAFIFGCGFATTTTVKTMKLFFKSTKVVSIPDCTAESVYPFVSDTSCIPSYMIEKEDIARDGNKGTEYIPNSVNGLTWCYKRLIRGGPSLRAAEVFNPQHYQCSGSERSSDGSVENIASNVNILEPIEEYEEDDGEGW